MFDIFKRKETHQYRKYKEVYLGWSLKQVTNKDKKQDKIETSDVEEKPSYQDTESCDWSKGRGHGSTGKCQLSKMTNIHDWCDL